MSNRVNITITSDLAVGTLASSFSDASPNVSLAKMASFLRGMMGGQYAASITTSVNSGSGAYATKTVTLTDCIAEDALLINGVAFEAGVEWALGADDAADAVNLAAAINASSDALVDDLVSATASGATVIITAREKGTLGNGISLQSIGSDGISIPGAGEAATGTLTCASVVATDTAVINGVTLTAVDKRETTEVTCVADVASSLNDTYFTFFSGANATKYYVWNNIADAGTDPAVAAATGIEVAEAADATADEIALATRTAVALVADADVIVTGATDKCIIQNKLAGVATNAANGAAAASPGYSYSVTNAGAAVGASEFQIGTTDATTAALLGAVINGHASLDGLVIAEVADDVITVTASEDGIEGNSITLAGTAGVTADVARLAGGTEANSARLTGGTGVTVTDEVTLNFGV